MSVEGRAAPTTELSLSTVAVERLFAASARSLTRAIGDDEDIRARARARLGLPQRRVNDTPSSERQVRSVA